MKTPAPRTRKYGYYIPLFVYREDYYQLTLEELIREQQEKIRQWEIRQRIFDCAYKTKVAKAGRMLEVEIYPSFLNRRDYSRALKEQRTGAAQKKQNDKNAARKLVRLVHTNFKVGDIFFTGGWSDDKQPKSLEDAKKEVGKFLDRLRYSAQQAGEKSIRYIYVIESVTKKSGTTKYHAHILLNHEAGANVYLVEKQKDGSVKYVHRNRCKDPKAEPVSERDWIEHQWTGGDYANTKKLQWKREGGFTGISKYFTKQFESLHETERPGLRRWGQSLGLKEYSRKPTESYSRFSKRRVAKLLKEPATIKAEFEKEFPGYLYPENYPCEIRYSEVIDGYYLYCRMYQKGGLPGDG